jgi:hypothetical protein
LPILHPDPVPPGVQSNLPVWTWTRQAVDGSFTRFGDGDGSIPWNRSAPRFAFASRTEPDQMLNPRPSKRIELTGFRSSGDSAEAAGGESVEEVAMGDVFRLDASSDPKDPDLWTPSFGSSTWMADTASFGWLTSPIWAPLPDFQRLAMGARAPGADVPFADYPELVLRKPTAFNCQTVLDPRPARYDLTNGLAMAYYGDSRQAPDANPTAAVNTSYARAAWVAGADATLNAAYGRVYHGDKGARLLDHDGALLRLQVETGRPDAARQRWTMQGMWNTLARFPNVNSMQMLWKNDDFEQLGEILDVFAWGPAYRIGSAFGSMDTPGKLRSATVAADNPLLPDPNVPTRLYPQCRATFAEIMTGRVPGFPVGEGDDTNRLQVDPPNLAFAGADVWQFAGDPALSTPYGPGIPWGARVFDAFTLDGPGASLRYDWSDAQAGAIAVNAPWTATSGADVFETGSTSTGSGWWDTRQDRSSYPFRDQGGGTGTTRVDRPVGALFPVGSYLRPDGDTNPNNDVVTRTSLAQWEYDGSPTLSGGFRGRPIKGLLNLNTAPVEVLRTLPHMTQMVYDDTGRTKNSGGYTDGSPYAGAGVVGGDRRFNAGFAPPAGKARNPASLVPDAIDIYRNRLNPSWLIGNAGSATSIANGATAWVPNPADPLQPRDTLAPTLPTYSDRGEAAPAGLTGGAATPARLNALWSFVRPANGVAFSTSGNISGSNRLADVPVPFNRGMRAAMGFGSMGELTLMSRTIVGNSGGLSGFSAPPGYVAKLGAAVNFPDWQYDQGWSIRLAGQDPYRSSWSAGSNGDGLGQGWFADFKDNPDEPLDARLATDRQGFRSFDFFDIPSTKMSIDDAWTLVPDGIAGDSEEQNLLFKGISNLVSTRSDVFTVYFRVRTIRQDALTGKWNGVDPDSILEDARYVMCVDRSNVNRPTDEPRIIYFSRVNE